MKALVVAVTILCVGQVYASSGARQDADMILKIASEMHKAGKIDAIDLIKADIHALRCQYIEGEMKWDVYVEEEHKKNEKLLKLELMALSEGKRSIAEILEYQERLLTLRLLAEKANDGR